MKVQMESMQNDGQPAEPTRKEVSLVSSAGPATFMWLVIRWNVAMDCIPVSIQSSLFKTEDMAASILPNRANLS